MDRLFAAVSAGERIRHFDSEVVRPDGLPTPVSLSLAPLPRAAASSAPQEQSGWAMVARDVTEQRLSQATLAEIDARLEEGEALSHVGSWLWDLRTGAVQWSLEFHRIHDIDPLDFAGTFEAYMDLIAPEDRDTVRAAMTQSVHGSRPLDLEYRTVDADHKTAGDPGRCESDGGLRRHGGRPPRHRAGRDRPAGPAARPRRPSA